MFCYLLIFKISTVTIVERSTKDSQLEIKWIITICKSFRYSQWLKKYYWQVVSKQYTKWLDNKNSVKGFCFLGVWPKRKCRIKLFFLQEPQGWSCKISQEKQHITYLILTEVKMTNILLWNQIRLRKQKNLKDWIYFSFLIF